MCNDWLQACKEGGSGVEGGAEGLPAVVCPLLLHRLSAINHRDVERGGKLDRKG